jgi:hypothetical protein
MMGSLSNPVNLARADFIICVGMLCFHHVSRTLVWFLDSDQEMGSCSLQMNTYFIMLINSFS